MPPGPATSAGTPRPGVLTAPWCGPRPPPAIRSSPSRSARLATPEALPMPKPNEVWIELTAPAGHFEAGAIVLVAEPIARAYVSAGRAVYRPEAQRHLEAAVLRTLGQDLEAELRGAIGGNVG